MKAGCRASWPEAVDVLINIDVPDLERAERFYVAALGLRVGRRFEGVVELLGATAGKSPGKC